MQRLDGKSTRFRPIAWTTAFLFQARRRSRRPRVTVMGAFEVVGVFVAAVAIGIGVHDAYLHYGPHHWVYSGVWSPHALLAGPTVDVRSSHLLWFLAVSHRLHESTDWNHDHHVGKFDPKKVRLYDNSTRLLTDDECDFLISLVEKKHDYNGYARPPLEGEAKSWSVL